MPKKRRPDSYVIIWGGYLPETVYARQRSYRLPRSLLSQSSRWNTRSSFRLAGIQAKVLTRQRGEPFRATLWLKPASGQQTAQVGELQSGKTGTAAESAAAQAGRSARNRTYVLWGVLLLGVLVLGGMAWRLVRQMNNSASKTGDQS